MKYALKLLQNNSFFLIIIICIIIMIYFGYQVVQPILEANKAIDDNIYSFDIIGNYFK
jgi:TRAP-type C4-dicarboxylate transport system permease small subunit